MDVFWGYCKWYIMDGFFFCVGSFCYCGDFFVDFFFDVYLCECYW